MAFRSSLVLLLLAVAGCQGAEAGELIVALRTDLVPELDFATVEVELFMADDDVSLAGVLRRTRPVLADGGDLRIGEYAGLLPATYRMTVRLHAYDGMRVAERNVIVTVRDEGAIAVTVVLTRSCIGVRCPGESDAEDATECVGGHCVSPECTPENPAACAAACEADAQCATRVSCAPATCDEGFCLDQPDHSLCGDGEYCDSGRGCTARPPPCSAESCVAQPCENAECVEGRCVITSLCAADQLCCNGECALPGCDDRNDCTADACGATGCENTPVSGDCDDGDFCNGPDTCVGGACSAHAGDPCGGAATCDAAGRVCIGCTVDADCGGVVTGSWSACSGFTSDCDATGTRTRTSRSFSCVGGSCIADDDIETSACSRSVNGFSCGAFGRTCSGGSCVCPTGGTELCTNGIDDDCDGLIDCRDSGCLGRSCDDANVCSRNETCQGDGSCGGALPGVAVHRCRTTRDTFFWVVEGAGSCADRCGGVDEGVAWRIPEGGTSSMTLVGRELECGSNDPDMCKSFYTPRVVPTAPHAFCGLGTVGTTYYHPSSPAPGTQPVYIFWSGAAYSHYMGFLGDGPAGYGATTFASGNACPR
ncbi:MAG: hypothetical protein DRJ42_05160 [Deltaproteobacteria bacterium]|nr:MAG: hypothetical protein DRJ42_05160 [Deltaproteobacteria bacterium]